MKSTLATRRVYAATKTGAIIEWRSIIQGGPIPLKVSRSLFVTVASVLLTDFQLFVHWHTQQ